MKKVFKILGLSLVIAGIIVGVIAGTISAAGPQNNPAGAVCGQGGGSNLDVVSELLGLTPEQIQEQRQAGKSLVQIAADQNVSEEALINAIMAEKKTVLQEMVTAGTITQEQADLRLEQMKEQVQLAVDRTTVGPPTWAGKNNGQNNQKMGAMRQAGQRGNQGTCDGTGVCTGTGGMMRFGNISGK